MEVNVPARILPLNTVSSTPTEIWPFDDGAGDPFWTGGGNPKPYRWELVFTITQPQIHSSHLTREPKEYNGLDVFVGDWIAGGTDGQALKIISVESKTETDVTCIVEDVLRYNTFRSPTGDGLFTVPGVAVLFEINERGNPILDPLPLGIVSADFYANLESRYKAFALQENFLLLQTAHGFSEGDSVSIDATTGDFEQTEADSLDHVVGSVSSPGPGPNAFLLTPTTKIVENHVPALPGSAGDFIYVDPSSPGDLTLTKTAKLAFLQLTNAVASVSRGTVLNATSSIGFTLNINGVPVTLTGTSIDAAVININGVTGSTGVVAQKVLATTTASTAIPDLFYGLVGNFTDAPGPASATINGTLVVFSDNTDGFNAFAVNVAIQSDMARDINAAGITNIVASSDSSNLFITETAGDPITIVNVSSDENGIPFAGPASGSGLPLLTLIATNSLLQLTRADGGEIIVQDQTGTPLADFGLVSVQNGQLPLGLVIEQGIRKGDMFIVANITARDALDVLIGDQAYVLDKDDGDWGLFLWDGSIWVKTATEESARVDSRSLSTTITSTSGSPTIIGEVNDGVRVSPVTIEVLTPFDGSPTIEVGDAVDAARLFEDALVDLSVAGTYQSTPPFRYDTSGLDTDIIVTFSAGGATVGVAKVTITYS